MKILLTGANGYVGLRLLPNLLEDGHEVVGMVRDKRRFPMSEFSGENLSLIEADLLESLDGKFPADIDVAFYLVHSMGTGGEDFVEMERRAAQNFRNALETTSATQIIYLSGIVPTEDDSKLSLHLRSRLSVERVLSGGKIPTTVLRAPIIVGSGSASFEIIRDLVEKLPFMIAPRWLNTKCQPIAIRNVIGYLTGVIDNSDARSKTFEIGGPEILTYREMLLGYADERKLKRWIISVPAMTPRLSSYWLFFVTSTSYPLAVALVDSMKHDVVCRNNEILHIVPQELLTYRDAVSKAFARIAQNRVPSAWYDAVSSGRFDKRFIDQIKPPEHGVHSDKRTFGITDTTTKCMKRMWSIGGRRGWYTMDWAWTLRGWLDRFFGGTGLRRGRRHPTELHSGDALDFWRVLVADQKSGRLLLYAEMKLPGEAWLEWKINHTAEPPTLVQNAIFRPNGLLGRLYWLAVLPFHAFVFRNMGRTIAGSRPITTRKARRANA